MTAATRRRGRRVTIKLNTCQKIQNYPISFTYICREGSWFTLCPPTRRILRWFHLFERIGKSLQGKRVALKNQKMKKSLQGKRVSDLFFTFRHCGDKDDACLVIRHHSGEEVGIKLILLNLVFFASRWVEEISSFLTWESATV